MSTLVSQSLWQYERYICPIRQIDDYIDSFGETMILSMLEAKWCYCQVGFAAKDCTKPVFSSHKGILQYTCVLLRLKSAQAVLIRSEHSIINCQSKYAFVLFNDLLMFLRTTEDHIVHVLQELTFHQSAGSNSNRVSVRFHKQ